MKSPTWDEVATRNAGIEKTIPRRGADHCERGYKLNEKVMKAAAAQDREQAAQKPTRAGNVAPSSRGR